MDFYRKKVFPCLAEGLWLVFLFLDLTGAANSIWVKYAAICLCCATALLGAGTADGRVVAAALVFTLAADWFLLVRGDHYTLGVCLFIVVQLLYAYRLYLLRGRRLCPWGAVLRLLLGVFSLPGPALGYLGRLACLASIYFLNLCVNCAEAFALGKRQRGFAWGLLLFICCDICVGAFNLGLFTAFTWWGSWLFYLPSQVLIVRSQQEKARDIP